MDISGRQLKSIAMGIIKEKCGNHWDMVEQISERSASIIFDMAASAARKGKFSTVVKFDSLLMIEMKGAPQRLFTPINDAVNALVLEKIDNAGIDAVMNGGLITLRWHPCHRRDQI